MQWLGVQGPAISQSWIKLFAQLASHVSLDKFINLSKPQFPHCKQDVIVSTTFGDYEYEVR